MAGRRRSSSFHGDSDAPPIPDFSALEAPSEPVVDSSAEEAEEEPDFDTLIQTRRSSGRRRSSSFHGDSDAPPIPDFSALEAPSEPVVDSSAEEAEEEPDFDTLIQTRRRSKSLQESEEDISNQIIANAHVHPIEPTKSDEHELAGPINDREVIALQKGLDEAASIKDAQAEREEQAELQAAARERIKRASGHTAAGAQVHSDQFNKKVKLLLLGDSGVGKSSIIQRYISDTFCPSLVSTLGVDLKTKRVHIDDKNVQVQVWDTAGQSAFHKITASYYKGSHAIFLVYDISDRSSFKNIEYWINSIKEKASAKDLQVAICGNKMDLRSTEKDCVSKAEGQKAADKHKVLYFETSAMTSGLEIDEAFDKIVRKVLSLDNSSNNSIRSRFSSDGTRSPESVSLFSKKDTSKGVLGKISEKNDGRSSPGTSPEHDAKKKDCVIC